MVNALIPEDGSDGSRREDGSRRLVFYLAMEEYLARHFTSDVFFLWQVPPTVIIGRNQLMAAEVNLPYCRSHGVQVYRRKSGGGCVYSDMGNIMVSYITSGDDVPFLFERYMRQLALCLVRMGLRAEVTGRNDILVEGRKVSGNAFYSLHGRNVMHGTLLFDSPAEVIEKAITPSASKLGSKGVKSVRQRVANIRQLLAASPVGQPYTDIEVFKKAVIGSFCDSDMILSEEDLAEIGKIEQTYLDTDFLYGRDPSGSLAMDIAVPGAGTLRLSLSLRHGRISGVEISGDFLQVADGLGEALSAVLKGIDLSSGDISGSVWNADQVRKALDGFGAERFVPGLDDNMLREAIFSLL